jgi:putative Mg2+ transporter-C (MgtC) family protein
MDKELITRFALAILWGGIIGSEREYRSKSAGFRTMIMISLGACFFTVISNLIGGVNNGDRIASNIVSGIGFLGAGVIFRGDNRVNGITTAATIWVVAAVGMGIGAGYYLAAACSSIFIILILAILPFVEKYIDNLNQSKVYSIKTIYNHESKLNLEKILGESKVNYKLTGINKIAEMVDFEWVIQAHKKNHALLSNRLMADKSILEFKC